jgi:hypothetical protein
VGELELANIGSSLKFCLLAEGSADCYPRLAPTSQWDTAAAQGVLEGAGGEVIGLDGWRSVIRRGSRCSIRFSWRCRPMAACVAAFLLIWLQAAPEGAGLRQPLGPSFSQPLGLPFSGAERTAR